MPKLLPTGACWRKPGVNLPDANALDYRRRGPRGGRGHQGTERYWEDAIWNDNLHPTRVEFEKLSWAEIESQPKGTRENGIAASN